MRVIRFESMGGASGDMVLAALLDLGVDADKLRDVLATLPLDPFEIDVQAFRSHELSGTQVTVRVPQETHAHRGLQAVQDIIDEAALTEPARARSRRVFQRLAEAEARVHDTTPDKIHFHEVGAVDSIVDIVGACVALEELGAPAVSVGPLPLGTGVVECAHGIYPVPAPATVELLKGMSVVQTDEPYELVTPTGAALLSTWNSTDALPGHCTIERVGCGFGHRALNRRPNMLRALLLQVQEEGEDTDRCWVLESNIDDTVPELLGTLVERLLEAGALDVFTVSAQMKKQRPGTLLTVLCKDGDRTDLVDIIFRECTTFGIREHLTHRTVLNRRFAEVETPFGAVRIKIGTWRQQDVTYAPEMGDCTLRAAEHQVAVRTVYEAALEAGYRLKGEAGP